MRVDARLLWQAHDERCITWLHGLRCCTSLQCYCPLLPVGRALSRLAMLPTTCTLPLQTSLQVSLAVSQQQAAEEALAAGGQPGVCAWFSLHGTAMPVARHACRCHLWAPMHGFSCLGRAWLLMEARMTSFIRASINSHACHRHERPCTLSCRAWHFIAQTWHVFAARVKSSHAWHCHARNWHAYCCHEQPCMPFSAAMHSHAWHCHEQGGHACCYHAVCCPHMPLTCCEAGMP